MPQHSLDATDQSGLTAPQACDQNALLGLVVAHLPAIRAAVLRKVPKQDVDDVVQSVNAAVVAGLPRLRHVGRLKGWLHPIIRRGIADYYRNRELAEPVGLIEESGADPTGWAALEAVEDRVDAEAVLDQLTPSQQELLRLQLEEGLTVTEAGRRLGWSPRGAESMSRRAKLKILSIRGGERRVLP